MTDENAKLLADALNRVAAALERPQQAYGVWTYQPPAGSTNGLNPNTHNFGTLNSYPIGPHGI